MGLTNDLAAVRRRLRETRARRQVRVQLALPANALPDHHFEIAAYFPDQAGNLYQLRQWYEPLRQVAEKHPVLVITRSAATALVLLRECPLPVFHAGQHHEIDPLMARQDVKLVLYVNHNMRNISMLWHPDALHVQIGHGESDKTGISASNQNKAYDFTFVSGAAGIHRIATRLINYDTGERLIDVGRPQLDVEIAGPQLPSDSRTTVLYAPSWEGDRASSSYGSLASHGVNLVRALIADGNYQVLFRPHPRTGQVSKLYLSAQHQVVALIEHANRTNSSSRHIIDTDSTFGWQIQQADVCIADISAVAYDWVATGKPLVLTRPAGQLADIDPGGIAGQLPLLPVDRANEIVSEIVEASTPEAKDAYQRIAAYYFGDTTPGASMRRFLAGIDRVLALRDAEIQKRDSAQSP